jgi:glycosyltransferase involved in cell wall biosynthesis
MRVVLVTHYYPAHRGGIEMVAGEIAQRLAARGDIEITWFASDCDPAPAQRHARLRCQPAASFNRIESWSGVPYPLWSWNSLARMIREIRAADLVHLHDCLYFGNIVAYAVARMARRPVLVTQHIGLVPFRNPALRLIHAVANRVFAKLILGGACRVAFIATAPRVYFERFVRFRRPPLTIFNGVDSEMFRPADGDSRTVLRRRFGVEGNQPLLLFVGRFVEKKGLPLLRELTRLLPEALWLFAGSGPLDPEHWAATNVRVMRGLLQAELVPLYQAADLLVLPSVGEGFPLVVQEAMACGTPALVDPATVQSCPQAAGLLPAEPTTGPDAAARWADRIRALASEGGAPGLREKLSRFAIENWSWENCASRHAQAMRDCVPAGTSS